MSSRDHHKEAYEAVFDMMCIGEIMRALGKSGTPEDGDNVPATLVEWLGKRLEDASGLADEALARIAQPEA